MRGRHIAEAANETSPLPLSALLSQVLVAFTIECDNESEPQMPHRTSNYGFGDLAIRAVREALEQLTGDNAARRPSGSRAAGWMICKAHPG